MEVNGVPGVPTCITPLEKGMEIRREDFRPFFAPLFSAAARNLPLPAGFYYKLFPRPAFLKNVFVKNIRRMAGVGRLAVESEPQARSARETEPNRLDGIAPHYDIVIVGAGMAGMSAALSAADSLSRVASRAAGAEDHGAAAKRILLIDEYAAPGGHSAGRRTDPERMGETARLCGTITKQPAIHYVPAATAQGLYPPSALLIGARGPSFASTGLLRRITGRAFVFATGAYDVLPLFENNTLPGIFGSRAIRLLLERDGYALQGPAVVYGAGDEPAETASLLLANGIDVSAIVYAEKNPPTGSAARASAGTRHIAGARLVSVKGRSWIRSALFCSRDGSGARSTFPCRLLCTAFRGQGAYELPYHAGFEFHFSGDALEEQKILLPRQTEIRDESGTVCFLAGEITGECDWRRGMEQGIQAGMKAAKAVPGTAGHGGDA